MHSCLPDILIPLGKILLHKEPFLLTREDAELRLRSISVIIEIHVEMCSEEESTKEKREMKSHSGLGGTQFPLNREIALEHSQIMLLVMSIT